MNAVKKIILSLGLVLSGLLAYAQTAPPEIQSVHPVGVYGEPHLRPGKPVIVLGKNFSATLSKNRMGLSLMSDNPQVPPPPCEYAGEVHLTLATPTRLEGIAPLSLNDGYYLLWVSVGDVGVSKAVKVWVGTRPSPMPQPIVVARR